MLSMTKRRLAAAVLAVLIIAVAVIMYRRRHATTADGMAPGRKLGATPTPSWPKCTRSPRKYAPIWMDAGKWYLTGGATLIDNGKNSDPINVEMCKEACSVASDHCDAVVPLPRTDRGRQSCAMYSRTVNPDPDNIKKPNAPAGTALGVVGTEPANCPAGKYGSAPGDFDTSADWAAIRYELPQISGRAPVCETVCTNTSDCMGFVSDRWPSSVIPMFARDYSRDQSVRKRVPLDGVPRELCIPMLASTYTPSGNTNSLVHSRIG
jgi:hypothetical protein